MNRQTFKDALAAISVHALVALDAAYRRAHEDPHAPESAAPLDSPLSMAKALEAVLLSRPERSTKVKKDGRLGAVTPNREAWMSAVDEILERYLAAFAAQLPKQVTKARLVAALERSIAQYAKNVDAIP